MTATSPPRQPAGTPTGGEFAAKGHTEADVSLDAPVAAPGDGISGRFRQPEDPTDPRASLIGDGFTDADGTRWTRCSECSTTVYAYRGSNEWLENGTDDGECNAAGRDSGNVHAPDERIPITEVRLAEEKVSTIRDEIATMASADIDDRRVGSVGLHGAVQRLAAAEVEADLWDRVQVRLDANPSEFPTVNSAIASVYDQVLEEIIDSGAHDTASGRSGDIRRVRFDAERTWLSRRRLQGQVSTPQRSAPTDFEAPPVPQVDDHGDDHDGTTTSSTPRSPEPVPDLMAALMESIERAKRDRQAKASPNADGS